MVSCLQLVSLKNVVALSILLWIQCKSPAKSLRITTALRRRTPWRTRHTDHLSIATHSITRHWRWRLNNKGQGGQWAVIAGHASALQMNFECPVNGVYLNNCYWWSIEEDDLGRMLSVVVITTDPANIGRQVLVFRHNPAVMSMCPQRRKESAANLSKMSSVAEQHSQGSYRNLPMLFDKHWYIIV